MLHTHSIIQLSKGSEQYHFNLMFIDLRNMERAAICHKLWTTWISQAFSLIFTVYNLTVTTIPYPHLILFNIDENVISIHKLPVVILFVGGNIIHINKKTNLSMLLSFCREKVRKGEFRDGHCLIKHFIKSLDIKS